MQRFNMLLKRLFLTGIVVTSIDLQAQPVATLDVDSKTLGTIRESELNSTVEAIEPVLIARVQNTARGREKHLRGEASAGGGSTEIDFDEGVIEGSRRLPTGVAVSNPGADHAYDLINLRLRWHPEMIQSTSNLETGQGR